MQLHHDADMRLAALQRKRHEEASKERQGWFQPKINAMSRATVEAEPRPPLHERIDDLQRQKEVCRRTSSAPACTGIRFAWHIRGIRTLRVYNTITFAAR